MADDFLLEIHNRDFEEPTRIELIGYGPQRAEAEREALIREIEEARSVEVPVIFTNLASGQLIDGLRIEVAQVTEIDLRDIEPDLDDTHLRAVQR